MALKVVLSQKTRHVVKKISDTYLYENAFGTFNTPKTDITGLNFPMGVATDGASNNFNIYICDYKNQRIVKLDKYLAYVAHLDVSTTIGFPYAISFDSVNGDLYVTGLYKRTYVSVARITKTLTLVKSNRNIYSDARERPYSICRGYGVDEFLITLNSKLIKLTEGITDAFVPTYVIVNEIINATDTDVIDERKVYLTVNKSIISGSYIFYKTYTEYPTKFSPTSFKTNHFPVLPGSYTVYKNTVELDEVAIPADPNDFFINPTTGDIVLGEAVTTSDVIQIRYKYEMIDTIDYTLNLENGAIFLTQAVSKDWEDRFDQFDLNYSYAQIGVIQTIIGEENSFFTGGIKHSNGTVYFTCNTLKSGKIVSTNSSYVNNGDSAPISKAIVGITEALDGSLLIYDSDNEKMLRYSNAMNYVEDVYEDNKVVDNPPTQLTPTNFQLSQFPVKDYSERVYKNGILLQRTDYALTYSTGSLVLNTALGGGESLQVIFKCSNDIIDFDCYDIAGFTEVNF